MYIDRHEQYPADLRVCRRALSVGSRSFLAASYLLPPRVRDAACALYAFCRLADDAIDEGSDQNSALADLHRRLDGLYAGRPHPAAADRILSVVVGTYHIPKALFEALLEGFFWDAQRRTYADIEGLKTYAARVAGSVGAMMALLMGRRGARELALACDLGIAMQLTNIARDVGEDARAGRLYLPLNWLGQAGLDGERWLLQPEASPNLAGVIGRLLDEAERLYQRADAGIGLLPLSCRPAIRTARVLYSEIGSEVRRNAGDSVSIRATVSPARKLALAPRMFRSSRGAPAEFVPEPSTQFLVDCVASTTSEHVREARIGRWQRIDARLGWLFGLYTDLELRDRDRMEIPNFLR